MVYLSYTKPYCSKRFGDGDLFCSEVSQHPCYLGKDIPCFYPDKSEKTCPILNPELRMNMNLEIKVNKN